MESHPLLQSIFPTSWSLRTRKPGSSFTGWFWLRIALELQSGCQLGLARLSAGLKACLGLASPLPNSLTCRITHDASLPGNEEVSQDMGFSALKAVGFRQTRASWSPYSCGCWRQSLDSWFGHLSRTAPDMAAGLPWSEWSERERQKIVIIFYNLISDWHTIPSTVFYC